MASPHVTQSERRGRKLKVVLQTYRLTIGREVVALVILSMGFVLWQVKGLEAWALWMALSSRLLREPFFCDTKASSRATTLHDSNDNTTELRDGRTIRRRNDRIRG
jgi:hypothetical protein